jgi:hypothetical protein
LHWLGCQWHEYNFERPSAEWHNILLRRKLCRHADRQWYVATATITAAETEHIEARIDLSTELFATSILAQTIDKRKGYAIAETHLFDTAAADEHTG